MSRGWTPVRLASVASLDALTATPADLSDDDLYIGLENIGPNGELIGLGDVRATSLRSNKNRFTSNDVLFGKLRPYLTKVARPTGAGVCSTDILVLRPSDALDRDYLYWWLRSPTVIEDATARSTGATLPRISPSTLGEFEIPVPPLAEQQRIVAKLDDVEAEMFRLAEVTERSREASDELFHRIIEDQLAEFYSSYPVRRIGDVLAVARGGSPRPIAAFLTSSSDGVNWVKISDATASRKYIYETVEKIKPEGVSRSRLVTSGDFLLSNSMSFGRPYIMRTTGCIHDGWLVLSDREKQFDEDYLFQLFSSRRLYSEFSRRAQGSTVSNLNSALVSDVSIPVPPIKVQKGFATQVGEIEADVSRLAELTTIKASKLKDLRASALAAAFRGDL